MTARIREADSCSTAVPGCAVHPAERIIRVSGTAQPRSGPLCAFADVSRFADRFGRHARGRHR